MKRKSWLALFLAASMLAAGCASGQGDGREGDFGASGAAEGETEDGLPIGGISGENASAGISGTEEGADAGDGGQDAPGGGAEQDTPGRGAEGAPYGETSGADGQEALPGTLKERQYSWQEVTVTFPEDWVGRCVVEEDGEGFSAYQAASYGGASGSGFLCGFYRTADYNNYGPGETLLAYTDAGELYYIVEPTDFPCDTEDEALCEEYSALCRETGEVKRSFFAAAEGVRYDAAEYVLPVSGISAIDGEQLLNLSGNDLWIARNEIYARHGRIFENQYLQNYFERCSWYQGTVEAADFKEDMLSRLEQENVERLKAAEQEYGERHPYPKEYKATETAVVPLTGSGEQHEVGYQVEDLGYGEYACRISVDGTAYPLDEYFYMVTPVEDVFYITDMDEWEPGLEIAVLDDGPSGDPVTYFFCYEEDAGLRFIGDVEGFPFPQQNGGVNGFDGCGNVTGRLRTDLIETAYLEGYWRYDGAARTLELADTGWNAFLPSYAHQLYENLPVHFEADEDSEMTVIPAQQETFFLSTDQREWILVKGKDGSEGYMRVEDGMVPDLGMAADRVFSDLYYFD